MPLKMDLKHCVRWPRGLAQHEFLQTLLIIGLFLFTVKERCRFPILFRTLSLITKERLVLYYALAELDHPQGPYVPARQMVHPSAV